MKRIVWVLLTCGAIAFFAPPAFASHGGNGPFAFATGGGKQGDLKFQISAHAKTEGVIGEAHGKVKLRNGVDLSLDVVCVNAAGRSAFIEGQDPQTGFFWDILVTDSGQPGGSGDLLVFSGPFTTPICPEGEPLGDPITSGNIVVHDAP
jgi:hypothetical protein